jgi:hypothetical protein
LANDTDVDSSSLTAILDSDPAHGLLSLYPNGSFVYTPTLDYHGPDSFTYHASDGVLNSDIVTVTLTVKRVYRVFLPVVQRNDGPQSNAATQRLARRNYVAAQHSRDGRSSATQLRPHPGCVRQITGDAFVERRAGGRRGGFGLSKAQHRMRVS